MGVPFVSRMHVGGIIVLVALVRISGKWTQALLSASFAWHRPPAADETCLTCKRGPSTMVKHNLPRLLVLAQREERWESDMAVPRPLDKSHLGHELRLLQARHVKDPAPWVERYRRANVGPTPPPCFRKTTQHPLRSQTSPENLQIFLRGSEQLRRLRALPANKSRITSGAAFSGW